MKEDYLFVNNFHLYNIIVDEKIGNTICGYIPFAERYFYVNIFTANFAQLYDLLQASKRITEGILLELAERLSAEEERPFIIDAENLNKTQYIHIHLGLCLRKAVVHEQDSSDDMGQFDLENFFILPESKYHFPEGYFEFSDELLKLAERYSYYQLLVGAGYPETEAKRYLDFEDETVFSLGQKCVKQFSDLEFEEKIDWSKIRIAYSNVENLKGKQIPRKYSVLLTINGYENENESQAIRANLFTDGIDLYPSECVKLYLDMGFWFNPTNELQNHTIACLKQLPLSNLKPLQDLISHPMGK